MGRRQGKTYVRNEDEELVDLLRSFSKPTLAKEGLPIVVLKETPFREEKVAVNKGLRLGYLRIDPDLRSIFITALGRQFVAKRGR